MKDTIFVQFYSKQTTAPIQLVWAINNGFSDTYDLCKSKGDFLWMQHNIDHEQVKLPIKKGKIFVSSSTLNEINQSYVWAKRYPNINFIVGGPAVSSGIFTNDSLPKNLIFTEKSVEQFFGVPDFSYEWKLDLPKKVLQDDLDIFYTYSISNKCYWNKCIFCGFDLPISKHRSRNSFDFKFKDNINTHKNKRIFLYTPSMSAELMMNLIPKLPRQEDLTYVLFMRSGKKENKALEEVLKKCSNGEGPNTNKILFKVGVEFPGNRMQNYMKKGSSIENTINTMKIIKKYNGLLYISLMLGWPNLIKQDVNEVEQFIKKIPKKDKNDFLFIKIWRLVARKETPLYNMVEKGQDIKTGPFYNFSAIKLSREAILLNNEIRGMLLSLDNVMDDYTHTLGNVYRNIKKEIK